MATSDGPIARLKRGLKPGGSILVAALQRVASRAVETARQAFEDQGRNKEWPPRAYPNVAGILEDAKTSSTPKARRFETRPAGINTGNLRNSIQAQVVEGRTVLVGSALEYASKFMRGGETTMQISDVQRKNVAAMIKKDRRLQLAKKFRAIANGTVTSYKVKTPPREVLVVTEQDVKDYSSILHDEVRKELAR